MENNIVGVLQLILNELTLIREEITVLNKKNLVVSPNHDIGDHPEKKTSIPSIFPPKDGDVTFISPSSSVVVKKSPDPADRKPMGFVTVSKQNSSEVIPHISEGCEFSGQKFTSADQIRKEKSEGFGNNVDVPVPIIPDDFDDWLPTKTYGKIVDNNQYFSFEYDRKKYTFLFEENNKDAVYNMARKKQAQLSLLSPRNNKYTIIDNIIVIDLGNNIFTYADESDRSDVMNRVWYSHRGHAITRVKDNRIKMAEFLTKEKDLKYRNGNRYDNRRCNLQRPTDIIIDSLPTDIKPTTFLMNSDDWRKLKNYALGDKDKMDEVLAHLNNLWEKDNREGNLSYFDILAYNIPENVIMGDFRQLINSPLTDLSIPMKGNKLANKYMREAMLACNKRGYPNMQEVLNNHIYRKRLFKSAIRLQFDRLNATSMISAYALKYYKVSNFSPSITRNLYDYYFLPHKNNKRVLDFCSGFGGRLIGFWASKTCTEYIGIDPNSRLIVPYQQILDWLKTNFNQKGKEVKMINGCAEDIEYSQYGKFDIIFTSPPYFDLELYNEEDTQSYLRYPEIELWRDKFLFQSLNKVSAQLEPEGILAINIKQAKDFKIDMINEMIFYLKSLGLIQLETLYLPLKKRPYAKDANIEPIFVFRRSNSS